MIKKMEEIHTKEKPYKCKDCAAQSLRDIQICFLQEESIMKRNRTNVRNAGRYFLAKEEHKESVVAI